APAAASGCPARRTDTLPARTPIAGWVRARLVVRNCVRSRPTALRAARARRLHGRLAPVPRQAAARARYKPVRALQARRVLVPAPEAHRPSPVRGLATAPRSLAQARPPPAFLLAAVLQYQAAVRTLRPLRRAHPPAGVRLLASALPRPGSLIPFLRHAGIGFARRPDRFEARERLGVKQSPRRPYRHPAHKWG